MGLSRRYKYQSPIGPLSIQINADGAVSAIRFGGPGTQLLSRHQVAKALLAYFKGASSLDALRASPEGTGFTLEVLKAVSTIPYGETRSYAWVAASIGNPNAARAVGAACGRNPVPLVIPCHRVVGSVGLGGYSGGVERKEFLLRLEGVLPSKKGRESSAA